MGTFDVVAGHTPSDADVELELQKWQQAQAFCNLTHQIDFAYDGVFWQADVDDFCSTMQVTVPDIIFVGEYTRHENTTGSTHSFKYYAMQTRLCPVRTENDGNTIHIFVAPVCLDTEGFGSFESWRLHVSKSANAANQRYPGVRLQGSALQVATLISLCNAS